MIKYSLRSVAHVYLTTCMNKGIPNVFRAGKRHPCPWDVARLSESVKNYEPQASVFLRFLKVEQHPKCMNDAILHGKPFGNCFTK